MNEPKLPKEIYILMCGDFKRSYMSAGALKGALKTGKLWGRVFATVMDDSWGPASWQEATNEFFDENGRPKK